MDINKNKVLMIKEAKKATFLPNGLLQVVIFLGIFLLSQQFIIIPILNLIYKNMGNNLTFIPFNLYLFGIFIVVFLIYILFIERRSLISIGFSKKNALRDYSIGYLVGVGLFSIVMLILFLTNNINYQGIIGGAIGVIAVFFFGYIIQGMSEEVMLRGYLLNSLGARHNLVIAVLVNSSLFGILHIFNQNISLLAISNTILFGIFASVYALKFSNIWGIGAVHSAWNFVQGNVYGLTVSGSGMRTSVFRFNVAGNELLNGGKYGPEGGLVTTIVLILATIIISQLKLGDRGDLND